MKLSTNREANTSPTQHSFRPGVGYVKHDKPPSAPGTGPTDKCNPPAGVTDGSFHLITLPGTKKQVFAFAWHAKEKAWVRSGGKRMAFTAEYLSSHGWRYHGAV